MVALTCPLCRGTTSLLYSDCRDYEYFTEAPYDFYRCGSCGFVLMHPLPTRSELPALYPANYHNFETPSNPVSRWLLDRYYERQSALCRRYLPAEGALLEVGCATGEVLARVQARGVHDVQGIELSQAACEQAWARGLKVFHGTLDEFETDQRFDVIFMSHVIEHVLDPVATTAKLASLLAPGGVLYLETPNVGAPDARLFGAHWGLIHYPRHLHLFDRHTVRALLTGAGLDIERVSWQINSCGWALSLQSMLRRRGLDRSRRPRSVYYPLLLLAFLPLNLLDPALGGTAFMAAIARRPPT